MSVRRALIWQGLFVLAAAALCIGLGSWQLSRLEWKTTLLAAIETRAHAPPSALPPSSSWPSLKSDEVDYLHVRIQGRFDLAHVALVFTGAPDGAGVEPGFFALVPFAPDTGGVILVNRGFLSQSGAGAGLWRAQPSGETTIAGWLRPPQKRNLFTPPDDPPREKWFTADPEKIAEAFGLVGAAPFLLEQEAEGSAADGLRRPAAVDASDIPNNHFSYALTWFGLALVLAALFAVYARSRLA